EKENKDMSPPALKQPAAAKRNLGGRAPPTWLCPPPPSVPVAWMGIHPHYLEMREFDIGDAAQVSMAFLVYQALVEGKLWHKVKGVELLDRQLTCFVDAEIGDGHRLRGLTIRTSFHHNRLFLLEDRPDECPYKKRKRHHRAHTQKKGHVRTHQEGSCLKAWKRLLIRNQPHQCLDLGLPASRTVRK
uniref:Uncharacterized protein n=1 Tax=Sus scrofa TaxID=9823 RepID=A0A8D1VWZ9_PIG